MALAPPAGPPSREGFHRSHVLRTTAFNELKVPRVLDVEFTQQGRRLPPSG